jgi:SRSO17 transposase
MGHRLAQGSDERFAAYVEEIASVIGHADRVGPLEAYCIGLLLPSERKSVEPMAAVTAPERVSAQHQSLAFHQPRRLVGRKGAWEGA